MAIKIIHQLISCALQDKETHRNPEKEKELKFTFLGMKRISTSFHNFIIIFLSDLQKIMIQSF